MDNYVAFGKGNRSLVVIPGLSVGSVIEAPKLLEKIFCKFVDDWRVYVIDRPDNVPDGTTNMDLANAYAGIMERLGTCCSDVIGASQGGMIAQHLAVGHPELVNRLVVYSTLSKMNDTALATFSNWEKMAVDEQWEELNHDFFSRLYTADYCRKNKETIDKFCKLLKPYDKDRFINLVKACMTGGPYDRLKEIRCPMLVIGSDDDRVLTGGASVEIAEKTGCELRMISGFGHAVYDEMPDFYDIVYDYLKI